MNTQLPEKRIVSDVYGLEFVSLFKTIQGEGPFAGSRALFLRLAGCNLQCPGCDTDYTNNRRFLPVPELIKNIQKIVRPPYLVVVTGGEPFRQDITKFCNMLERMGYVVQIETNGSYAPSPYLHPRICIVCSPKTGSINAEMARRADFFKYVLHSDSVSRTDGLPILALDHTAIPYVARPSAGKKIYLQPMDCKNEAVNRHNIEAVRKSCMEFGYILQLQIHKIIGVE